MSASLVFLAIFLNLAYHSMANGTLGIRDSDHMRHHLPERMDFNNLTYEDLIFHYFRVHDVEGNNKLDGCEILQSLLHFHSESSIGYGAPAKVFTDFELSSMVDTVLESDDKNDDGFIDYPEFLSGQISKGFEDDLQ